MDRPREGYVAAMSETQRIFHCAPEDVFAVLEDGWTYGMWVVGAARIRAVDAGWPAPGSKIHHSVGLWPVLLSDTTSVEEVDAPREITLTVRAWPTGQGRVRITCEPHPKGTLVTMEETASSGPATAMPRVMQDPMLHVRNVEALRRLSYLAENRGQPGSRA
jgi:hypothetical protein